MFTLSGGQVCLKPWEGCYSSHWSSWPPCCSGAFGPGSAERYGSLRGGSQPQVEQKPVIKGPDDDEEFLWNIEKNRFKERRAREEAERKRREEEERRRRRDDRG